MADRLLYLMSVVNEVIAGPAYPSLQPFTTGRPFAAHFWWMFIVELQDDGHLLSRGWTASPFDLLSLQETFTCSTFQWPQRYLPGTWSIRRWGHCVLAKEDFEHYNSETTGIGRT